MAKPDINDGHARIANELIRAGLSKAHLSGCEWQVIWAVIGKTLCWHKRNEFITFDELAVMTFSSDLRNTKRAVKSLVRKNILKIRIIAKATLFEFNQDYDSWVSVFPNHPFCGDKARKVRKGAEVEHSLFDDRKRGQF